MYSRSCITLVLIAFLLSVSLAANCFGPASKLAVTEFDAFPSPVSIGSTVYIRAVIEPTYAMGSAQVQLLAYYSDNFDTTGVTPLVDITGLDFCNLSTSISCPLPAGSHVLSWEYTVPNVLPGTYQIKYIILEDNPPDGNPYSCIQFTVDVAGLATSSFTSWYNATLLGTAIFTQPNYQLRQIGENLQVGPSGPLNGSISPVPAYGSIKFLSGSGDLVPNPYYDTSDFVWGLSGVMVKMNIGPSGQISHIYQGDCYLGYIDETDPTAVGNYYDYLTPLIEGTFTLNWTYMDSSTAEISGYAYFVPTATVPYGWGYPLLYGRLGEHEVYTSDVGFLQIQGSLQYCASGVCATPPAEGGIGGGGLSSQNLGLAIGLPIAAVFIIVLIAAALLYMKKKRETEQEDGVFAVNRKPEYGSALVVDGIIEETMGSKTMQAMLDMRDEDDDRSESDGHSDKGHSDRGRSGRSRSRSNRSISRSRSGSRHTRSESDPGESASRDSDAD